MRFRTLRASLSLLLAGALGAMTIVGLVQPAAQAAPLPPGYTAVTPTRLLDTRVSPGHGLSGGQTALAHVSGVANVPASGVAAVVLNVTGVAHGHSAFLTVYPTGSTRPTASNVNIAAGATKANSVIVPVGSGGGVTIYNSAGTTDVIVDISGYFASSSTYAGQAPARILDTRLAGGAPLTAKSIRVVPVAGHGGVPNSGVSDVVLNVTGISTKASAYLTAYETGIPRPTVSNLNLAAQETGAVMVVGHLDSSGRLTVYNSGGPTHVVVDVLGYFTGSTDYHPVTPTRLEDSRLTSPGGPLQVSGFPGVPAGAGAAVLSVTAVKAGIRGFLTVFPDGTTEPSTSNVNVSAGGTTANLVVAQLSNEGKIAIDDSADAYLLVDVVGWISTNAAVHLQTMPTYPAELTQSMSIPLPVDAGRAPYTWSIDSGSLPPGVMLSADGKLTGTPTAATTATALVEVTDDTGETATAFVPVHAYSFVSQTVWGWGNNNLGSLPTTSTTGVQLSALSGITQVATGGSVGIALKSDGTVWAWGQAPLVGNNGTSNVPATAPVQVQGLSGITAIAASANTIYALKSDGTVWEWGAKYGAANNGTFTTVTTPTQVPGITDAIGIGSTQGTGYAIRADHTLLAWGDGHLGQLGQNPATSSLTPLAVPGLTGVQAVVPSGNTTAYAVTTGGNVWAWGGGGSGQLGNGSFSSSLVPVQVTGLTGVTQVAAGIQNGYALKSNGTVWAWGAGSLGRLGNGTEANSTTPVQVSDITTATGIAATTDNAYAVDSSSGHVWAWGLTSSDLLGDGLTVHAATDQNTPTRVVVPPATAVYAGESSFSAFTLGVS